MPADDGDRNVKKQQTIEEKKTPPQGKRGETQDGNQKREHDPTKQSH